MPLIIGLGNPGDQYEKTRHNAGFMVLDALKSELGLRWSNKETMQAQVAETNIDGKKVVLAKPMTFMNNSGEAVQKLAHAYKFAPCEVWVVYDDATLPFGILRVRLEGSAGGHNGIKSIIKHLGAEDFVRLRVGVGEPPEPIAMEDWVLGKFDKKEQAEIESVKEKLAEKIIKSIKTNLESVTENLSE